MWERERGLSKLSGVDVLYKNFAIRSAPFGPTVGALRPARAHSGAPLYSVLVTDVKIPKPFSTLPLDKKTNVEQPVPPDGDGS